MVTLLLSGLFLSKNTYAGFNFNYSYSQPEIRYLSYLPSSTELEKRISMYFATVGSLLSETIATVSENISFLNAYFQGFINAYFLNAYTSDSPINNTTFVQANVQLFRFGEYETYIEISLENYKLGTYVHFDAPQFSIKSYYFDATEQNVKSTTRYVYGSYFGFFFAKFEELISYAVAQQQFYFFNYYPRNVSNLAWNYFNTDTGQNEEINLAGLMYNISWYLGNLYQLNSSESYANTIAQPIREANQAIADLNAQEDAILNQITASLNFDTGIFSQLQANLNLINWVSSFLQQIYDASGLLQLPINLSMTLGLLMYALGSYTEVKTR